MSGYDVVSITHAQCPGTLLMAVILVTVPVAAVSVSEPFQVPMGVTRGLVGSTG